MNSLPQIIGRFIDAHRLLDAGRLHLVALSGGADSVALLLVLRQLGFRVEAAHCNFHLRGSESDRDEHFCLRLCESQGVALHRAHFDTHAYAAGRHLSIEMAARQLRYAWFDQLRQAVGAADIVVAHHRDDSVETFLLNLVRGTGIHGLTGIKPRQGFVVRPMLCVGRNDVLSFLEQRGQAYVTDSSNLDADAALRNRVRLDLLPLMETVNMRARDHIAGAMQRLAEVEKVYAQAVDEARGRAVSVNADADTVVSLDALRATAAPETFLYEWISAYGFNAKQVKEMMSSVGKVGRQWISTDYVAVMDRRQLLVALRQSLEVATLNMPEPGTYVFPVLPQKSMRIKVSVRAGGPELISRNAKVATVDAGKVTFPLTLRPVREGDRFRPFGMAHDRLVSDYLTDLHRSAFRKRRQLMLVDAVGRTVWLVGERTDDRCRVDSHTADVLTIKIEETEGQ